MRESHDPFHGKKVVIERIKMIPPIQTMPNKMPKIKFIGSLIFI